MKASNQSITSKSLAINQKAISVKKNLLIEDACEKNQLENERKKNILHVGAADRARECNESQL